MLEVKGQQGETTSFSHLDITYMYTPVCTLKKGINSDFSTWDKQDIIEFSLVIDKKAN